MTPRYSFGLSTGMLYESAKRELPRHLQSESMRKRSPGPADYEMPSTLKKRHRAMNSLQESTWSKVAGDAFNDLPQNNPGPAHYSPERSIDEFNKPKSSAAGYTFPLGPKDVIAVSAARNRVPGPGAHEHQGMRPHTFNRAFRGEMSLSVPNDKLMPVLENGVPGPGAYNPDPKESIPSTKIS